MLMAKTIDTEFLDIINAAICQTVDDYVGERAQEFFRRVGDYHLEEAIAKGRIDLSKDRDPLENLIQIARYLESVGYMKEIKINKLSKDEAKVEMFGVSVTGSSVKMLKAGKEPSHYMTNVMMAALERLGIRAELEDVSFDEEENHFKEHWKVISLA
jgi:hypothetical protein